MGPKPKTKKNKKPAKEKINENQLMMLMQTSKVLGIANPQQKAAVWGKITKNYNDSNNTSFSKDQIITKYKNYKKALKKVKSSHTQSVKKTGAFIFTQF